MIALQRVRALFIFTAMAGMLFISSCGQDAVQQASEQSAEPVPPAPATLEQVKADLAEVKMAVANEGDYLCCVEPACDWCLLKEGTCACRENLEAKKEVCAGCGLGWHNDQGAVDGVKASDVKWNIAHSHGESENDASEVDGHAH